MLSLARLKRAVLQRRKQKVLFWVCVCASHILFVLKNQWGEKERRARWGGSATHAASAEEGV